MKTKITIEIETKGNIDVVPEEHMSNSEKYSDEELKEFQEGFTKEFHEHVNKYIKNYFDENFKEEFMDELEDYYIEGYDEFDNYNTTIKVIEENKK